MTLDGESSARLTGKQMFLGQIDSGIVDCPINNLIELCVALNTGDLNLVLECKVAFVDNTELRQLALNGVEASFLPEAQKAVWRTRIKDVFSQP